MLDVRLSSIRTRSLRPLLIAVTQRRNADSEIYLGSRISDCIRWSCIRRCSCFCIFSLHMDGFAFEIPRGHWARRFVRRYVEIDRLILRA